MLALQPLRPARTPPAPISAQAAAVPSPGVRQQDGKKQQAGAAGASQGGTAGSGRRLYELAISVMAGPPGSVFRNTKVGRHTPKTLKPKP